jgi:DNA invertase Pin-like site-specific DNA recombinase
LCCFRTINLLSAEEGIPMNVAVYFRVSTTDQNVNLQRDAVTTLCARHSDWVVTEYVDTGVSGTKDSRPALNKLMADCRRGKIDKVAVWKFDRFARSVSHLLKALEEFQALGVDFVSVTEAIDTSSAMGKLVFTILGAVAELERSLIVERVRAGQRAAKARGKHIGRPSTVTQAEASTIASMRRSGASERKIAALLGLSNGTVHRVCASQFTPMPAA